MTTRWIAIVPMFLIIAAGTVGDALAQFPVPQQPQTQAQLITNVRI